MSENHLFIFKNDLSLSEDNDYLYFLTFDPKISIQNIKCLNTCDYFSSENHQQLARDTSKFINLLEDSYYFEDSHGVHAAYKKSFIFESQFSIYHVMYCITLLTKIIEEKKISSITLESSNVFGDYSKNVLLVLEVLCDDKKINLFTKDNVATKDIPKIKSYLKDSSLYFLEHVIFYLSISLLQFKLLLKKNKDFYLINDDSYATVNLEQSLGEPANMLPVYLATCKRGYFDKIKYLFSFNRHCAFLPNTRLSFKKNASKLSERMHIEPFKWNTINLSSIFSSYFFEQDSKVKSELYLKIKKVFWIISKIKPKAIFSQQGHGIASALGEIAVKKRIKSFFFSHGSHIYTNNADANLIWRQHAKSLLDSGFEHTLIQTEFEKEFIHAHKLDLNNKIKVGPLIKCYKSLTQDIQFNNKLNSTNNLKFLYASSPKHGKGFRPMIYETYDEYISNMDMAVKAISTQNDCKLIIRHRDTSQLHSSTLNERFKVFNNTYISNKGDFISSLSECDFLISYSSTCIEEALILGKIVILIDFQNKYNHLDRLESFYSDISGTKMPLYYYASNEQDILDIIFQLRKRKMTNDFQQTALSEKIQHERILESILIK